MTKIYIGGTSTAEVIQVTEAVELTPAILGLGDANIYVDSDTPVTLTFGSGSYSDGQVLRFIQLGYGSIEFASATLGINDIPAPARIDPFNNPSNYFEVVIQDGVVHTTPDILALNADETLLVILAGDSTMVGTVAETVDSSEFATGTLQFKKSTQTLAPATNNLDHHNAETSGNTTLAREFSQRLKAARPYATIVFQPSAQIGSGFFQNNWNPGDALYNYAVNTANTLLTSNPSWTLHSVLCNIGSNDATNNVAGFKADLEAMISAMRTDITRMTTTTPFVFSEVYDAQSGTGGNVNAGLINAELASVVTDTPFTSLVSSAGLDSLDNLHFDSGPLDTLGERVYKGIHAANDNLSGYIPTRIDGLKVFAEDTKVRLDWFTEDQMLDTNTDYVIQYKETSSGAWGTFVDTTTSIPTVYVTGLTNETSYDFRVAGFNSNGQGDYSEVVTTTPSATVQDSPLGITGATVWYAPWDSTTVTQTTEGSNQRIEVSNKAGGTNFTNATVASRPRINVRQYQGKRVSTHGSNATGGALSGAVLADSEFTLTAVVQRTGSGNNVIAGLNSGDNDYLWAAGTNNVQHTGDANLDGGLNTFLTNEWMILTIVQRGSEKELYKNGVSLGSVASVQSTGSSSFIIGGTGLNGANGLIGHVFEIVAYDKALSPSELTQLHSYISKSSNLPLAS